MLVLAQRRAEARRRRVVVHVLGRGQDGRECEATAEVQRSRRLAGTLGVESRT
jgi:hypothetical protein